MTRRRPPSLSADVPDERLAPDRFRWIPPDSAGGDVVLVGVVHDHPASTYRVRTAVERIAPSILALELPPLAVPLFREHASGTPSPPFLGGEMSAAVQAADTDRVVGIDGPSIGFFVRLLRTITSEPVSTRTVKRLLVGVASVTKHTIVCRLAAIVAALTSLRVAVGSTTEYDCERGDPPEVQAASERRSIRRAQSIMSALGTSAASRLRDQTREAHMAGRLAELRRDGDVVAIVGYGHLDPLADRLAGREPEDAG